MIDPSAPMSPPQLDRVEMEQLYTQMLAAVVVLARALGKPCPVVTRAERREERRRTGGVESSSCETSNLMVK